MDAFLLYWILGIILVPGIIFAIYTQTKINSTYREYKHQPASTDKTADQIAREILDKNELQDIVIEHTPGELTDHYDPGNSRIRLSEGVYGSNSVAAIGIAAHEVGHAIQRKEGHFASKLRTLLVPIVNFSSVILFLCCIEINAFCFL